MTARTTQRGITLLELMMALGIMGLMMFLGYYTVRAVSKSELRADTVEVGAALMAARNLATQSSMHHRVVFNLDEQMYRIEVCPDPVRLVPRDDEEDRIDPEVLERLAEQPDPLSAMASLGPSQQLGVSAILGSATEAESPEDMLDKAAAIEGVRIGSAKCGIAPASGGDSNNFDDPKSPNVHKLGGGGIKMRRIYVQHLREPVSTGEVSVNFFALGHAEKALIELADREGEQFTVLLHGLTGRVEVRDGAIDPDKHMRRNAIGDDVEDREEIR